MKLRQGSLPPEKAFAKVFIAAGSLRSAAWASNRSGKDCTRREKSDWRVAEGRKASERLEPAVEKIRRTP